MNKKNSKGNAAAEELAQAIFNPQRMDVRARAGADSTYDSPAFTAEDLRAVQLAAYRRAGTVLEVAVEILEIADSGGWVCKMPTVRTLELIRAARKELRRATRTTRGIVARLDGMRKWPKMRRTA